MEYDYNKVRVSDIPHEGLSLSFELAVDSVSERVNAPLDAISEDSVPLPMYLFLKPLPVQINLFSEGQTVEMKGEVNGDFQTLCSRCGESARSNVKVPISVILKPKKNNGDVDDLGYILYSGEVLDCADIIEELLILDIPYAVYCSPECKGLCPDCGINLNTSICSCHEKALEAQEEDLDEKNPFSRLKSFVVN
jgi:uncharacterized protein